MKIGNKIIHLDSVDSTSNYIANLMKEQKVVNGTVILADNQFKGKGQRGAEWVVKPGDNLTFSFLLTEVNLSVDEQFFLTELVSLSLVHLLRKLGMKAYIKWPNDIFVNKKKIAGILIENQLSKSIIKKSIIGIGLNVNQIDFPDFPATSVKKETGEYHKVMDVLFSFISSFNEVFHDFSISNRDKIHQNYLSQLFLLNENSFFEDRKGEFAGEIVDVLKNGYILISKNGEVQEYVLKEIKFKL